MTPSPNYGARRRPRSTKARELYLIDLERSGATLLVTVAGPRQPPVQFEARDESRAVTMIDLLRQGAFSLPINPA